MADSSPAGTGNTRTKNMVLLLDPGLAEQLAAVAALVVIAGQALGVGTSAALAQIDVTAAETALAEASLAAALPDPASAAAAWAGLVHALLRHPPFPGHRQQIAVAAGLQLLALNGWQANLDPPATAVVVEALASGRLSPAGAAAWLMPRLSPRPAPRPNEGAIHAIQRSLNSVLPVRGSGGAGISVDGRMLARFTDQAAAAVSLARQEARRLGHDHIDPEHILLGLTRQEDSVAGRALHRLGISLNALHHQVEEGIQPGQATPAGPIRPSRPRGQKVLSSALPEALAYGHCDRHGCPWMSTGHLLLAQFHDDGDAAQTLTRLGAGENHVRSAVTAVLTETEPPPATTQDKALNRERRRQRHQPNRQWPAAAAQLAWNAERLLAGTGVGERAGTYRRRRRPT